MSKGRIPSHGRPARGSHLAKTTKKTAKSAANPVANPVGEVHRFIGVSLGGGKSDKACVAVVEYYPKHHKVFLSRIFEKIKSDENISADLKIHEIIEQYHDEIESVAFDVPMNLPNCMTCKLKCPGYENCKEPQIEWMWNYFRARNKKKKPRKIFTPYTQRAVEMYLATEMDEPFILQHALGANTAPLLGRAHFIARRLHVTKIEVFPKLSLWRIGKSLHVMKSHLRFHKHAVSGEESRRSILHALSTHNVAFVYDQDVKLMIANNHAFEAFICALTAFLKYRGLTEKKPDSFPKNEDWIEFPLEHIKWDKI